MAHKILYLIRHGQTPGNAEKRYIGRRTDESLTEEGVRMAEETARCLAAEPGCGSFRLCAGPMKRTQETAAILSDAEIEVIAQLTEIDFGDFEGKNYEELRDDPRYQAWIDANGDLPFPHGEDRESFIERSWTGFLEALGDPHRDETIVTVCHGGNIMAILSRLTGEDYYAFMTKPLAGYRLELETEDAGITDHTYRLFDGGHPA